MTYAELELRARRFGDGLHALRCSRGDRVAIYMRNSPEYVITLLGLFKSGLVAVPINVRLHEEELAFILANCACRGIIFDSDKLREVEQATARAAVETLVESNGREIGHAFEDVVELGDPEARDEEMNPEDLAWIFYTSGTTGRPKGAMLTHRNLMTMIVNCLADVHSFQPNEVVLHVAPLSHGSGLFLLPSLARGSTNVIYGRSSFIADEVLRTVEQERVEVIAFLAPTMIALLVGGDASAETISLRCLIYGGGPMHPHHSRAAISRFGQILVQIYGQGEAPMTISYLRAADHDVKNDEILASAGFVRTGVEARIVDERDSELPQGAIGEVVVRGDVVMRGYWGEEHATTHALRGGWLHTGDIGYFDKHDRLHLLDRKDDAIISGGANIYPREVEDVLLRHPDVHDVAVFGVPDLLWGQVVYAAVVPAARTPSAEELIRFCADHIARFKKPKRIAIVESLPKNAYGKVLRRELVNRFSERGRTGQETNQERDHIP